MFLELCGCVLASLHFELCCSVPYLPCPAEPLSLTDLSRKFPKLTFKRQEYKFGVFLKETLGHVSWTKSVYLTLNHEFDSSISCDWLLTQENDSYPVTTGCMSQPGMGPNFRQHSGERLIHWGLYRPTPVVYRLPTVSHLCESSLWYPQLSRSLKPLHPSTVRKQLSTL